MIFLLACVAAGQKFDVYQVKKRLAVYPRSEMCRVQWGQWAGT